MLIYVFPSHYQLVYVNFDIFSFSLISYHAIRHILEREMTQNTTQFDANHDTGGC